MDFGFLFDRVLHFYGGLSYRELLELPIRTFWRLHANINRIRAESDLRSFHVAAASQSEKGGEYHQRLVLELGEITKVDPIANAIRDEEGVSRLKQIAQSTKKSK